jgi:imidazolonepropionase-like amidohydrolase
VPATLLIRDATVVDTLTGARTPSVDVLVRQARIVSIRPSGGSVPGDAEVVDAHSRFLVPGYVDMHAHPYIRKDPRAALTLMTTFGITGVRQLSGSDAHLRARAAGTLPAPEYGPRLLATCGNLVMAGMTADQAVAEVRHQHELGADFIKAISPPMPVFEAVVDEAARLGLPVAGHLPGRINAEGSTRMTVIEHLGTGLPLLLACSSDEQRIRAELPPERALPLPSARGPLAGVLFGLVAERITINPSQLASAAQAAATRRAIDSFDEDRARNLARMYVAAGTWHCPTLIRLSTQLRCDAPEHRDDPYLRYVHPRTRRTWRQAATRFAKKDATIRETLAAQLGALRRLVGILDSEGVNLLAGTDAVGAAWVVPGSSLHLEAAELAAAGLSPLRVLQLLTSEPARCLGIADAGVVREGARADLVLLDADPLLDVAHLGRIDAVILDGVHLDASRLQRMRDEVEATGVR